MWALGWFVFGRLYMQAEDRRPRPGDAGLAHPEHDVSQLCVQGRCEKHQVYRSQRHG